MTNTAARIIISATDQTKAAFASVNGGLERLQGAATAIVGGLGAIGAGAGIAGAALGAMALSAVRTLDQLDEFAEKTGMSVERLSGLRYAAEVSGTSFGQLTDGMQRLVRTMADAADGQKEAASIFDSLGISVADATGRLRPTEEVLGLLANRFASMEDGADKAALAQKLFGRAGIDLIPILSQGADGIARLTDEAEKLGAVYDGDTAKAAAELNDNLAKIGIAAEAASAVLAGPLVRSLAEFTTALVQAQKEGASFEGWLKNIYRFSPVFLPLRLVLQDSEGKPKTTAEIQAYVNSLGGLNAGGGRGFRNPAVVKPDDPEVNTGSKRGDPLADAKRYLETLQKQGEKLQELTAVQQALRDIELGRLGTVTPQLREQILVAARLVDVQKADKDSKEAMASAAEKAAESAGKLKKEARELFESVQTPAERFAATLERINQQAIDNPLIDAETVARLRTQAWDRYRDSLESVTEQTSELDEFQRRAAKNVQDQLGQGLFDAMNGNFKNIGDAFTQMLNRMVAEALAAKLSRALFGDLIDGGTGEGSASGLLGTLGKSLLGIGGDTPRSTGDFARLDRSAEGSRGGGWVDLAGKFFAGFFADGGAIPAGQFGIAGEAGMELVSGPAHVYPLEQLAGVGRAQTVSYAPVFYLNAPVDRRSQDQIAGAAMAGAQRALSRNY